MKHSRCLTTLALLAAVLAPSKAFGYAAIQNKADNTEIRIVPRGGTGR